MFFGHVKGAFTGATSDRKGHFELASGGTLFLDEIADMPTQLQAKLLRVLEDGVILPIGDTREKRVDVRVVAATNADLQTRMAGGLFRSDLYFRLARFTVEVPPLRERREDIPLLANHFIEMFAAEMGTGRWKGGKKGRMEEGKEETPRFSQEALEALMNYPFPGNVRELKNIIEHALILSRGGAIQPEHLHFMPVSNSSPTATPTNASPQTPQPTDEETILAYLRQHDSISNSECRQLLNVNRDRAFYLLNKMYTAGLLTLKGSRRWARYYLCGTNTESIRDSA
jgi:DNA-binding NtrC family response regulator